MKNKKTLLTLIIAFLLTISISNTNAQTTLGGGLAYGTEIENLGINVTSQFFINDKMAIEGSFTYYLPKDVSGLGSEYKFKWYELNANLNYYFAEGDINFYGVGGLNMTFLTVPTVDLGGILGGGSGVSSETESKVGLNIGAGADFDLGGNITPFAQIKYVLGDADQLQILGGVRFDL